MVRINLLTPFKASPRVSAPKAPESSIRMSLQSVAARMQGYFGITNPLIFMAHTSNEPALVNLKNDILSSLKAGKQFSAEELAIFEHSFDLMIRFHGEEKFPEGERIAVHLLGVARILAEWGANPKAISAALLHLAPPIKLMNEAVDKEVLHLLQRKKLLQNYLYCPLEKPFLSEESITKLTELCLIHEGNRDVWLLEAADQCRTFFSLNDQSERTKLLAYRNYHITSKILSWFDLDHIAVQVEDASFYKLDKEEYLRIEAIIDDINKKNRLKAMEVLRVLTDLISEQLIIPHRIEIGVKSVARAMIKINSGDILTDASRFRIIIKGSREDCKNTMKIVMDTMKTLDYSEDENERKNYIAGIRLGKKFDLGPKENGYESIHLHFRGEEYEPINVQIRTEEMHETAEIGSASHGRWKLNSAIKTSVFGTASSMRNSIIDSGHRYVIYDGNIYRLIPYPLHRRLKIIDMLTLINPDYALRAPIWVWIERISKETGDIICTKVRYDEPLQNADRVLLPDKSKKASTARVLLKDLSTLVGQLIHKLTKSGEEFDPEASGHECESAAKRGLNILDPFLSKLKIELENRLRSVLKNQGEDIQDIQFSPLLSLTTIASNFGLSTSDELLAKIGLIRRKENIIDHIMKIVRISSGVVATRKIKETGHFDCWALLADREGIINSFLASIGDHKFDLVSFSSRRMQGGYVLLKVRAKVPNSKAMNDNLNNFLKVIDKLYLNQKPELPSVRQKEITIELSLKTLSANLIAKILLFFQKPGITLIRSSFPPIIERKTTGNLHLKIPASSQDELPNHISEQLKLLGIKKVTVTKQNNI